MDLEEFLAYLHNGAYSAAQYLIMGKLTLQDRKNLRRVSHTLNAVMLDYPILTTLHISTHKADLEYVELVSKNERLLQHVTLLSWDHSMHDILLLHGSMYMKYGPFWGQRRFNINIDVGRALHEIRGDEEHTSDARPAIALWSGLTRMQKLNLEKNTDYRLMLRILPHLKNIQTIIFITHDFRESKRNPALIWSPAMQQWHDIPDDLRKKMPCPSKHGWTSISGTHFPSLSLRMCPRLPLIVFPVPRPEHNIWHHLPIRGIKFFDALALNQSGSSSHTQLQQFFPKLVSIDINNIPKEFLIASTGGTEYKFLRRSSMGIRRLELTVPMIRPLNTVQGSAYNTSIQSLILPGASSLQYLSLTHVDKSSKLCSHDRPTRLHAPIQIAIDLLPQLPLLSYLVLAGGKTTISELQYLADAVRDCPSMQALFLGYMFLEDGSWRAALHAWRTSRALYRMKNVQIDGVKDNSVQRHVGFGGVNERLYTRNFGPRSTLVRWLNREHDVFPLYADSR